MDQKILGPLMISVNGLELTLEEKEILEHPAVSGVILFTRNYDSLDQIRGLIYQIKNLPNKNKKNHNSLLISIDHEGGTVQRIKEPLTVLPPMAKLGKLYELNNHLGLKTAYNLGWLLAAELLTLGFDFSFTPVLDLNLVNNKIIKYRSFHKKPSIVSELALSLKTGLASAGMEAVGKHYPGHGAVKEDSHLVTPVDERRYKEIDHLDLEPYRALIKENLSAIMTSHILYNNIDKDITTFSNFWLKDILRDKLGFKGLIISDDLNMAGAKLANDSYHKFTSLVQAALTAGCELLLLCNNQPAVIEVLDNWSKVNWKPGVNYYDKLNKMRANDSHNLGDYSLSELKKLPRWQEAYNSLVELETACAV